MTEKIKICADCMIKWDALNDGSSCPQCRAGPFFVMNAGDIGTAMYFDQCGLSFSDVAEWKPVKAAREK